MCTSAEQLAPKVADSAAVPPPIPRRRTSRWFTPAIAPMLRQRKLVLVLGAMGVAQLSAGIFHLPGVICPMLHGLGIPCPGCGATRACAAMLRGDWHTWLKMHALAPCFLLAVGLFAAAAVFPARPREAMIDAVEWVERRTGLTNLLLALLLAYWFARLVYDPAGFARLMRG
jgi:hypothetical protein